MNENVKCDFCGKDLNPKDDRIVNGEFYEDIVSGFAEGREDLPDITICADCYQTQILDKIK